MKKKTWDLYAPIYKRAMKADSRSMISCMNGFLKRSGMMTYSTLPGKAICRLVWNMDGEKNLEYLTRALSGVPENFTGKLLEVPVGTALLP